MEETFKVEILCEGRGPSFITLRARVEVLGERERGRGPSLITLRETLQTRVEVSGNMEGGEGHLLLYSRRPSELRF